MTGEWFGVQNVPHLNKFIVPGATHRLAITASRPRTFRKHQMTNERRRLIFAVVDGDKRLFQAAHTFTQFYRCDQMLAWLVKNKLTGRRLVELTTEEMGASWFQLAKFVLTKVKKESELQPVMAGTDFMMRPLN